MTPEERQVIDGIFERLRNAESQPRDLEAERYIEERIRRQPYAPYTLAQAVFIQEQALENQHNRIEQLERELESARRAASGSGGFLSGLFGGGSPRREEPANSARQGASGFQNAPATPNAPWGGGAPNMPAQRPAPWGGGAVAQPRAGMGFMGTAASAAAGIAGGMVLGSILTNALGLNHGGGTTAGQEGSFLNDSNAQPSAAHGQQDEQEEAVDAGHDFGDDGGGSFDA